MKYGFQDLYLLFMFLRNFVVHVVVYSTVGCSCKGGGNRIDWYTDETFLSLVEILVVVFPFC